MHNAVGKSLEQLLLDSNLISQDEHQQILEEIEKTSATHTQVLSKFVNSKALALAKQALEFGVPCILLEDVIPETEATDRVSASFAYRNKVLPTRLSGGTLTVAMSDVLDIRLIDEMRLVTECEIEPMLADDGEIEAAIIRAYGKTAAAHSQRRNQGPCGCSRHP